MRMGKTPRTRGWSKAGERAKPQHITTETRVGQVSADLMKTYFQPKIMIDIASVTLERYASDYLIYQDALAGLNHTEEVEISADGSIVSDQELPLPPPKPLFYSQTATTEIDELFSDISEHFFSKGGGWKVHVNAAKFERNLEEKYGVFRPFIKDHPEIELFLRSAQRKYAMGYFSPFRQGSPPIPRGTAIILLFMMQRGQVRWDILLFAALFLLIGLQPWALIVIVCIVQGVLHHRKNTPVGAMKRHPPSVEPYWEHKETDKKEILLQPVGNPLATNESIDTSVFDALVVGTGCSTLYAAALLSRAGRKVLVLSSTDDASGCVTLDDSLLGGSKDTWGRVPFDIENCSISKIAGQQTLLAPALATTEDGQGGIRFAKIGSDADGYAFQILSVPGMGTEKPSMQVPYIVKTAGCSAASLMEDAAVFLGDNFPPSDGQVGDSLTGQYLNACKKMNEGAGYFFMSKLLPDAVSKLRSDSEYKNASIRSCAGLLNACFPLNAHLRSFMAAIGMSGENLTPGSTSMAAHITNVCSATSDEGMHYPIGGPRALCHALVGTIEQCGGRVLTRANVTEFIFDESIKVPTTSTNKDSDEGPAPCCVGLQLTDGRKIQFSAERYNQPLKPVVVSMEGFIPTFIRYLPDDIRTKYKVPRGLPALAERRPVMHFLYAIEGSAQDLDVTGADYFRLPGAAIPRDEVNPETGAISYGEIGWAESAGGRGKHSKQSESILEEESESVAASSSTSDRSRKGRSHFVPGTSWMRISFPSAKDPSFQDRHGSITTCVITIEADDDLVTEFDTKPRIFATKRAAAVRGNIQRLSEIIKKELLDAYPQLEGKVKFGELRGPFTAGLSNNPERYAAMGIRPESPYPGLYAGGPDLSVGQSFSGGTIGAWLVANAICGYNAIDHLVLQKNVTSDLDRFLPVPLSLDHDGLAVPLEAEDDSEE